MSGVLFDTNVWIACVFEAHPFHSEAQLALRGATQSAPAVFCRATEQSFLRLLSTPTIFKTYGINLLTNSDALIALDALQALSTVGFRNEPAAIKGLWHQLAASDTASPKVWMDAYLAAFAITSGLTLMTLDQDFKKYVSNGLKLDKLTK